ncbi:dihydroxyacetone kinase subunit DhaL [Paenarthrobacter nicotinovorans]|uniref:dihydroxyacetone kinase subunit DhaL n=1 Tax=Paenarthrobacter nicotinovorans TaxID=29320 RepID=UPI00166EF010|nr:dihydroxyacetone kinase subunit DhaL [Paenarthrobacter nicotinovorans]MBP2393547.1 dihydroxyacetone kinase [Paenarthrobacter nicotinovorans]UKF00200.1 dihydroxyacetone kinase subunit L [Paenarthrobacter nicotinovorans]UKF04982.1 dihydroxyacetone kinase subunit L [Paenarthrobacter nicotinovorans]GGV33102.1 erythrulose kinase [Paenarthrobacter nicotinovorans]
MTQIFDNPADFADEALDGFVAANRGYVARVDGGVVRSTEVPAGQVALVVGGGSGHYPAFAGLVGPGLAAGSACGNMFASPAAGQVYRVAKAANAGGGVLLSYGNYAGDVLHFGQAQLRLNAEGIETRTVTVTDDIASAPIEQIEKRRGIAGDLTVFKIAGAAAEAGLNLDDVERLAIKTNYRTRSLGVAFDGCTLPGATDPLFHVPAGQMSLGLGIHGEPGISEHPMPTASELADLLVSKLLADKPEDAGDRVVAIVNGLGTVKYDELFLLFGKIEKLLSAAGLTVVEPECGELVTSLDMSGLSLTLLWLDEELEQYWAAPADTPAFRKGSMAPRAARAAAAIDDAETVDVEQPTPAAAELGRQAVAVLAQVRDVVVEHEEELGKLDAIAGDGDHGIGMRRGVDAAAQAGEAASGSSVARILASAGEAWSERAGGTSGALWGSAVIAAGLSLGNRESYSSKDAAAAVEAFTSAITELGKADPGDKTMVDALLPFRDAFLAELDGGAPVDRALAVAAAAAESAAANTADLRPLKGRARPLAEKSIGHPDPGAVSFGLIAARISHHIDSQLAAAAPSTAAGNGASE